MYTIKDDIESTIIIKNSKFITNIYYVESLIDIKDKLELIKNKYNDATHNTYAYILGNNIKCSDDNEPSNTAGKPMLNVLTEKNLNNILVITTRYFGGIKLGVGGLVRAYTKSVTTTLNSAIIVPLIKGYNIDITFNYNSLKEIDYLLKDTTILKKEYNDIIKYNLDIDNNLLDKLNIITNINITINEDKYIKKLFFDK